MRMPERHRSGGGRYGGYEGGRAAGGSSMEVEDSRRSIRLSLSSSSPRSSSTKTVADRTICGSPSARDFHASSLTTCEAEATVYLSIHVHVSIKIK